MHATALPSRVKRWIFFDTLRNVRIIGVFQTIPFMFEISRLVEVTMHKTRILILAVAVLLLAACQAETPAPPPSPAPTQIIQIVPVVITPTPAPTPTLTPVPRPNVIRAHLLAGDNPVFDPAIGQDPTSVALIDAAFVPLVRLDEITNEARPGMATSWQASPDSKVYTFTMRANVPWVKYDATSKQMVKVQTCPDKNKQTKDRLVSARDFEYGILRALKSATASPYAPALAAVIDGADAYLAGDVTDVNKVGVKAIDDATLTLRFKDAYAFAPTMASLAAMSAVPRWLIEGDACITRLNDKWTDAANLQTYGPFVLKEYTKGATMTLIKNPSWVADDSIPLPNIDQLSFASFDGATAVKKFQNGELDVVNVPTTEFDRVQTDAVLAKNLTTIPNQCVYYYGFNTRAKFVDDPRVRRALSMTLDRAAMVTDVVKNGQQPAQWFGLPGLMGEPTLMSHPAIGVKFDPTQAKGLLDEYLKEKNLTADKLDLSLTYNPSTGNQKLAEAAQQMWRTNLGVTVKLVSQEWDAMRIAIKGKTTPQIWRLGWCLEYPDANNFLSDVVASGGSANPSERGTPIGGLNWRNDVFEDIVRRAALEKDQNKRTELYAQAEQILVNDAAALMPIYWYARGVLTQPWITRTFAFTGRERYERWQIVPD
jgi:oligopeptide transport system substrate-binding protein